MMGEVWRFAFTCGSSLHRVIRAAAIDPIYCSAVVLNRRACMLGLWLVIGLFVFGGTASAQSLSIYEEDFAKATFRSPETVWEPAISAGGSVAWNDFAYPIKGFGPGWQGYGHHYAVALADNVNGKFMRQFVFAAAAQREDNYAPTSGGVWARIGLAAAHTIYAVPGTESWKLTWKSLNWSGVPASFASAGLSNAYQPGPQRNLSATFERVGTGTAGYAAGNVMTALASALKKNHPRLHIALRNRFMRSPSPE